MNWIKPDWPLPAKVRAAVTLRSGGVSVGSYASLNPAGHVNDDPQHVQRNRQIIRDLLELPAEPVWLQQVHASMWSRPTKCLPCQPPMPVIPTKAESSAPY